MFEEKRSLRKTPIKRRDGLIGHIPGQYTSGEDNRMENSVEDCCRLWELLNVEVKRLTYTDDI